jgi:hypothetical protein
MSCKVEGAVSRSGENISELERLGICEAFEGSELFLVGMDR